MANKIKGKNPEEIRRMWRIPGIWGNYSVPLLRNKRFMLDEKLQRNALKFAIFLEYENPYIPKIWKFLKHFSGALFHSAQTQKL